MRKAWTDIRSFITVVTMLLLAYCVVLRIPIPEYLKEIVTIVVSFFLGVQSEKLGRAKKEGSDNNGTNGSDETGE